MVTQSFAAPSAGTMYANEAITVVPVSEINALSATNVTNADLLRAIQALVLSVAKATVPIKGKPKPVSSSNSNSVQAYCWTHGHCVDCIYLPLLLLIHLEEISLNGIVHCSNK